MLKEYRRMQRLNPIKENEDNVEAEMTKHKFHDLRKFENILCYEAH
jgi:hypothetical protein